MPTDLIQNYIMDRVANTDSLPRFIPSGVEGAQSRGIFVFIFGLISGVLFSSFIFVVPLASILIIIVGLFILLAEKIWSKKISKEVLLLSLVLISFGLGALRYSIKDFHEPILPLLSGVVISEPEERDNSTRFVLLSDNDKKIMVNTKDLYSPVRYGDRVVVEGRLSEPGVIDDGINRSFDYAGYLAKDDIYHTLSFASVEIISRKEGNSIKAALLKVKNGYESKMREILPEPASGLLSGLTIAGKGALPKDLLEQFRRAGVIHVVVLSGFHITIIIFFLFWFFSNIFLFLHFGGPKLARLATIFGLAVFVLMAGASASILRASLMALIAVGGKLLNRAYSAPRALLVAIFLMVIYNPKILVFDVGFHLSFLATAGIIYLAPIIEGYLSNIISPKFSLRNLISITLSAQIAVSPYLLYSMGNVSLIALLANILILPVVPLAMATGFMATLIAFLSEIIALPFSYISYLLLSWIIAVARYLGDMQYALFLAPNFPFWATIILYVFIVIFVVRQQNFVLRSAN